MNTVAHQARPKINLFLHVTGRRSDGYHLLESLVCFAKSGDQVSAGAADDLSLRIEGPFAAALAADDGNLVLCAARALQNWARHGGYDAPGAALLLEKRLPIASGIGGGSADAAAALNALTSVWKLPIARADLEKLAVDLGADVPVCLNSETTVMRGIGEILETGPKMPPAWIVLANPMREVSTAAVFSALDPSARPMPATMPSAFDDAASLAAWLAAETRNDLEGPARALVPEIDRVLAALSGAKGAHIARMSGSGATCFALFDGEAGASAAAAHIASAHPDWWIEAAAIR